jgi:hypothetical protein
MLELGCEVPELVLSESPGLLELGCEVPELRLSESAGLLELGCEVLGVLAASSLALLDLGRSLLACWMSSRMISSKLGRCVCSPQQRCIRLAKKGGLLGGTSSLAWPHPTAPTTCIGLISAQGFSPLISSNKMTP